MQLTLFTDGGSLNNPGQAAYAYSIFLENKLLYCHSEKIGVATNNVAEYRALIEGLKKIIMLRNNQLKNIKNVVVKSDSSLLVNQLNGLFKVKDGTIRELVLEIRMLENKINLPIKYIHIYREDNVFTDSLVKKALK